jgi:RNA polymerase sigma-B factor
VRVPRRLQELKLNLATLTENLAQALRCPPTTTELADRLGVSQRDVLLAQGCATAYRPISVHQPTPAHDDLYLLDTIADTDHGMEAVDNRETLRVLIADLPARERRVVRMRFFADMTQAQIAAEIGVSQMHVSRMLTRTLTQLRDGMLADTTPTAATAPAHGIRGTRAETPHTPRRQTADRVPAVVSAGPVFSPGG